LQGLLEQKTRMAAKQLLFRPSALHGTSGETLSIGRDACVFDYLSFQSRRMDANENFSAGTGDNELGLVILGGTCSVTSSAGEWLHIGKRRNVFEGIAYTLYLPIDTQFTLTAETSCDIALCYCAATKAHPARLIAPSEVEIEIRGGGNATRQINHLLKPEFPADRILLVEVYTPSGNWSSYPPHKHDVHNPPAEVDLEEIYYYKIDRPEGYAIQRVYTTDGRLDETLTVRDGELVFIPEGYHPVVAAHGYNAYYLNALAGSARSMAASDDPNYAWVRGAWREKDPRVPVVAR
jgi:5-deoxy-glucuronate isomerase